MGHSKSQEKRHGSLYLQTQTHTHNHLEWKRMPPVKERDNILKHCVCCTYSVGPGFILGSREKDVSEREYAYTQFTLSVQEIQDAQITSFVKC